MSNTFKIPLDDIDIARYMRLFSPDVDVWDGDVYYRCQRVEARSFTQPETLVAFICGKCTKAHVHAVGDVCPECWSVATERPKIGDTLNIRRPMRFTVRGAAI